MNSTSTFSAEPNIIFECSDLRKDIGLMVTKSNNDDKNKFGLHLYYDYTNQAIAMILDIKKRTLLKCLNHWKSIF